VCAAPLTESADCRRSCRYALEDFSTKPPATMGHFIRYVLFAFTCFSVASSANAEHPCFQLGSTGAVGECLSKELRASDKALAKVATLVSAVKKSDRQAVYKELVVENVLAADKQWRALLASECALAGLYYFPGSMTGNAELECKLTRTIERSKFIGESDVYRLLVG